jgi:hypothetical protein
MHLAAMVFKDCLYPRGTQPGVSCRWHRVSSMGYVRLIMREPFVTIVGWVVASTWWPSISPPWVPRWSFMTIAMRFFTWVVWTLMVPIIVTIVISIRFLRGWSLLTEGIAPSLGPLVYDFGRRSLGYCMETSHGRPGLRCVVFGKLCESEGCRSLVRGRGLSSCMGGVHLYPSPGYVW